MKIDRVTFTVLRHTLSKRYGDAQGLKTHRTTLLVKIDADAGITGWGDISNVRNDANVTHLREAREALLGQDPLQAAPLVHALSRFGPRVAAGIDIALADMRGKAAGMNLATLLGGAFRTAQPCYASLQNGSDEEDQVASAVAVAEEAMRLGFHHIKMKVGCLHPDADAAWIDRVLDSLPEAVDLAIDANRVLDLPGALRLIRQLRRPERIAWFEEPVGNRHPAAYKELRERLALPIAGGESMGVPMLQDVVAGRMMDIIQPDLVGHGGFAVMQALFALCDAYGVRLIPHCFDGQIMRVATLHLLAARPDYEERHGEYDATPLEVDISPNPLRDELLTQPIRPGPDGRVLVPAGPGLGIEIDEAFVGRTGVPINL